MAPAIASICMAGRSTWYRRPVGCAASRERPVTPDTAASSAPATRTTTTTSTSTAGPAAPGKHPTAESDWAGGSAIMRSRFVRLGIGLTVLILGITGLSAMPSSAYSGAFFHTQSRGNRGVDVQAVQFLLQARGYSLSADGNFGSGTDATVRAFQAKAGLSQDGIV